MKIVCDIPNGAYEELCNGQFPVQDAYRVVAWIKNGTPLPKGHGRLIDADALAKDLDYDVELDARALDDMYLVGENRRNTQFDKDCKQNCMWYLSEAPTIIEAEKEGAEE